MSRVSGIAEIVRLRILRGELGPGERVVELHLAERLGVARSTLREALRRLEGEGLLIANESGGMRVIDVGERELIAALQLRASLESLSADLAARAVASGAVTEPQLADLEEHATGDTIHDDRHFHRAIAALGANHQCRATLDHVWDRLIIASVNATPGAARITADGAAHRELLAAITAGDGDEAAAVARRHVLAALA